MLKGIKNLHLKIAIIIAPIMAIGGWGLAETIWNASHPEQATTKRPYTLCDLVNAECDLQQGDLTLTIKAELVPEQAPRQLRLVASHEVTDAVIALSPELDRPRKLHSSDGLVWSWPDDLKLPSKDPGGLILRMVVKGQKSVYIGEMKLKY
jgi:hypothetical protein